MPTDYFARIIIFKSFVYFCPKTGKYITVLLSFGHTRPVVINSIFTDN